MAHEPSSASGGKTGTRSGHDKKSASIEMGVDFINAWFDFWFPRSGLPGLSVAILHKDRMILNRGWGYANLETGEALTPAHTFRAASHAKMFTATAIALLRERDLLDFDDPAAQYLPWLKKKPGMAHITIRHLLGHGSGLTRDGDNPGFFPDVISLQKQTRRVDLPLENLDAIKYSNWGYGLLGQIIETVASKSYENFITEEIIKPLGLHNTAPEYCRALGSALATGYKEPYYFQRDRIISRRSIPARALTPAFGLYSTPSDLSRFVLSQVRAGRDVIGSASKQSLNRYFNTIARGASYGLGRERQRIGKHLVIGHQGFFPGHRTFSAASKELDLAVSIAINCSDGSPSTMAENIFKTFFYFMA